MYFKNSIRENQKSVNSFLFCFNCICFKSEKAKKHTQKSLIIISECKSNLYKFKRQSEQETRKNVYVSNKVSYKFFTSVLILLVFCKNYNYSFVQSNHILRMQLQHINSPSNCIFLLLALCSFIFWISFWFIRTNTTTHQQQNR